MMEISDRISHEIAKARLEFIAHGGDLHHKPYIRDAIKASWQRSRQNNIDPHKGLAPPILFGHTLELALLDHRQFLEAAAPFVRKLEPLARESDYMIVLYDSAGVILDIRADERALRTAAEQNIVPGTVFSEQTVGTCANGLCSILKTPIQVSGPEHYSEYLQGSSCSAAPIFYPNGNLAGVLTVESIFTEKGHIHTLGWVTAIAWAIQNQIYLQSKSDELFRTNAYLESILSSMDSAILAIDRDGRIIRCNQQAETLFELPKEQMLDYHFEKVFGHKSALADAVLSGKSVEDMETSLPAKRGAQLMLQITPILDIRGQHSGALLSARPVERIKKLVNKMSGAAANFSFDDIISVDPSMSKVINVLRQAVKTPGNLLLTGESGTGKELLAEAAHNLCDPDGPFVAVNCAAIPRSLIESELFGYTGGAFTGARRDGRPGKVELANGGTLFLDEIGDMPLEVQPVLLRVLQEKKVMRLGGDHYTPVSFKVIAATNQDLTAMMAEKRFREDLYYRLAVFRITIPPLRERRQDIVPLAEHFVNSVAQKISVPAPQITSEALDCLVNCAWPGNVRQLENAMSYAASVAKEGKIGIDDLPTEILAQESPARRMASSTELTLAEMEKIAIQSALAKTSDTRLAAELLGIGRSTLYRKRKEYGLTD